MNDFYYRKLNVYHKSMELVANIYRLSRTFPEEERFGLSNQIQRAVISVPSNIAEGMGRFSNKERVHFLEIANGSLNEVMCELELSHDESYISEEQLKEFENKIIPIKRQLSALHKSILGNGDYNPPSNP